MAVARLSIVVAGHAFAAADIFAIQAGLAAARAK
jgi:hypothetical protein